MGTRTLLRNFIRQQGEIAAIAFFTFLLLVIVVCLAAAIDLLLNGTVNLSSIYFITFIALLTSPVILYFFVSLIRQLDRSEEKLLALSIMDDLTDVYNRRYFIEQAEKELAKGLRYGTVFSIMAVDIDHFKQINDGYGHFAGDAVLQAMANTCMNNLRSADVFARFGGEEFMFLIPESDKTDIAAFSSKILKALENTVVVYQHKEIRFTVSIGVKAFDKDRDDNLESLLKAADDALYEAKRRGRNCVVIYEDDESHASEL